MKIIIRIRFLTFGLVLITALLVGVIMFQGYTTLMDSYRRENIEHLVINESKRLQLALREVQHDVQFLERLSSIDKPVNTRDDSSIDTLKQQLEAVYGHLLQVSPNYDQVRFIGLADYGREIIRVDRRGDQVYVVPTERHQQKSHRNYFIEAVDLPEGEFYLSNINLNREFGQIEVPYHPTLRAALPVYQQDQNVIGIVIINMNFQKFIEELFPTSHGRYLYYITNESGDFLVHPDPEKTYGFDFGKPYRLRDEFHFPENSFLQQFNNFENSEGMTFSNGDRLIHFLRLNLFDNRPDRYLLLGIAASYEDLASSSRSILLWVIIATFVLVCLGLMAGYVISSLITQPLKKITLVANRICRGEVDTGMLPKSDDEIGILSHAFDHMVLSLKENETKILAINQKLRAANSDLEHFSHIAAHDLREPLRKQRNLADLIVDQLPDASFSRELMGNMVECTDQMSSMINDFRVLTKVGYQEIIREKSSLKSIIEHCLEEFKDVISQRKVSVLFDELPTENRLYASIIRILYQNLINNALNHVHSDAFTLIFTAELINNEWVFGVKNTGSSIPKNKLHDVFKVFRKMDLEYEAGTGIGLSLCKKIIDKHQGRIYAESGEDFTHIRFTLGNEHE